MSATATALPTNTSDGASASCVTVSPGKYGHVPIDACNSYYSFDPDYGAAICFSILFSLLTLTHIIQAFTFKKGFCWVVIMGATWEMVSFITRALGSHDQQNIGYAIASQLLLFLAPLWVNAFAYMTLGRMIYFFLPEKKLFGVKGQSLAKYFVLLDIVSFIVQGVGGSIISPGADPSTLLVGIHTYMAGIGVQELFICIFTVLVVTFHRRMLVLERMGETRGRTKWKRLTFTLYAVLALISIRIIYRLIEYSSGINPSNPLPYHEVYSYCLDALPMLIAIFLLTIVHPGYILVGPESHFPSRKEKKATRKARKQEKKARKEEKKARKELTKRAWYSKGANSHENELVDVEQGPGARD